MTFPIFKLKNGGIFTFFLDFLINIYIFVYMNDFQKNVKDWMILAKQSCPDNITIPDNKLIDLRLKLIQEELDEIREDPKDIINVADGLADLLYVVYGMAVAYGLDMEPIFNEVHRSNMTKFIDGNEREDGKWIKGPSYTPADLTFLNKKSEQLELNLN